MDEWRIVFYRTAAGKSPPQDFLDTLDVKIRARFDLAMEQLRAQNVRASVPLVKPIEGKLWELRLNTSGNAYRLLYFFYSGRRIVFVHGFQKKTQKTPPHEIDLARWRMADYLSRSYDDD